MFNKFPCVNVNGYTCSVGWQSIISPIGNAINKFSRDRVITIVELYPGVFEEDIIRILAESQLFDQIFNVRNIYKSESEIREMVKRDLTEDPVFGTLSYLKVEDYFDIAKFKKLKGEIDEIAKGQIVVVGSGASELASGDILIYADMARWEIQQRQRKNERQKRRSNFQYHEAG